MQWWHVVDCLLAVQHVALDKLRTAVRKVYTFILTVDRSHIL